MIVGVDYSTKAVNLASHREGQAWQSLRLEVRDFDAQFVTNLATILELLAKWQNDGDSVVYIEQPWSRYNPATAMKMTKVATAVQVVALQQGYRVQWAHVASWRSRVFGKGKYPKAKAKQLAIVKAEELSGLTLGKDDNAADAICIAAYGEMKELDP